jgi:hypothetical protein
MRDRIKPGDIVTGPESTPEKRCSACGEMKPIGAFHRYRRPERGPGVYYRSRCKPCFSAPRPTYPTVDCQECGSPFQTRPVYVHSGVARFCSVVCKVKATSSTPEQQMAEKVDRSAGLDACWPWIGFRDDAGYGMFRSSHRKYRAHRVAWEFANGQPVPDGLLVRHLCVGGGNPWCCNPEHLAVGTVQDNSDDMVRASRHVYGERQISAKLKEWQVRTIRNRAASGETQTALAREFGVAHATVSRIVRRVAWGHVS